MQWLYYRYLYHRFIHHHKYQYKYHNHNYHHYYHHDHYHDNHNDYHDDDYNNYYYDHDNHNAYDQGSKKYLSLKILISYFAYLKKFLISNSNSTNQSFLNFVEIVDLDEKSPKRKKTFYIFWSSVDYDNYNHNANNNDVYNRSFD